MKVLSRLQRLCERVQGVPSPSARVMFIAMAMLLAPGRGTAQGVTNAGVRGTVLSDLGQKVDATIRVSHDATGFVVEVRASGGHFLVQGLEPGGPYTITARAVGYLPQRRERVDLELGAFRAIDFRLPSLAV